MDIINHDSPEAIKEVQVEYTQHDIREIRVKVEGLSKTLMEVHTALIGNPMAKDGGLIQRIVDSEGEIQTLKDKIAAIEKERTSSALYLKIIYLLGGLLFAGIVGLIEHYIK